MSPLNLRQTKRDDECSDGQSDYGHNYTNGHPISFWVDDQREDATSENSSSDVTRQGVVLPLVDPETKESLKGRTRVYGFVEERFLESTDGARYLIKPQFIDMTLEEIKKPFWDQQQRACEQQILSESASKYHI